MSKPIALCDCANTPKDVWRKYRQHGPNGDLDYTLGGSDVAVVFGVSPFKTPLELWWEKKTGKLSEPTNQMRLYIGDCLEPVIASWFEKETGQKVINDMTLYQHPDHLYALANVDRLFQRTADAQWSILEIKTVGWRHKNEWGPDKWPIYYNFQPRFYMSVLDIDHAEFAASWGYSPATDFVHPYMKRNQRIEDLMWEKLDRWIWSLRNDRPPKLLQQHGLHVREAMRAYEAAKKFYGASSIDNAQRIILPDELMADARAIEALESEIKDLKDEVKKREQQIASHNLALTCAMEAYEHAMLNDTKDPLLIDWVTTAGRTSIDSKKLKEDFPDAYDAVKKVTEGSRKLKISHNR